MPLESRSRAGGDAARSRDEERAAVLARHDVSRETLARLDAYVALLLDWQRRINLVAPSTLPHVWTRHVADSIRLAAVAPEVGRWADLGSGAGLPGVIVAIVRGVPVDLIESNAKKAAFLRAALRETGAPGAVHAKRIEDCGDIIAAAEGVSARALASLDQLLALVALHLGPGRRCFFLKGRNHAQEIAAASAHWRFAMVKHEDDCEDGSAILEISDVAPRGA